MDTLPRPISLPNGDRYRLMVESVAIHALVFLDLGGVVRIWNPGAERLFGWESSEVVGRSGEILWTVEDRAAGAHIAEMVGAASHGNAPDERWHLRRDGSRVFVNGVMTAVRVDGELVGYAKVARDATVQRMSIDALVESEGALRAKESVARQALGTASRQNEALSQLVSAQQAEVRRLADLLAEAVIDEQRRISAVLHDDLQQLLVGAMMRVQALRASRKNTPGVQSASGEAATDGNIAAVLSVLAEAYETTRSLTSRLVPPDVLSVPLGEAFEWLGNDVADIHGLAVEIQVDDAVGPSAMSGHVRALVFQSARELLFNVVKHAGVSEATIRVEPTLDALVIAVEDAGCGLSSSGATEGYGLQSIRARLGLIGGELVLTPRAGGGTRAEIRILDASLERTEQLPVSVETPAR